MTPNQATTPDKRVAALISRLTDAQRATLASSKPLLDARILVPGRVARRQWPEGMTDIYSVAFRRLTPLGLSVRTAILSNKDADK